MSAAVFTVRKLDSCEDEELQATLARLRDAGRQFARDMIVQGALPDWIEGWIRLFQFTREAAPNEMLDCIEGDAATAQADRIEAAYLGGVAVGPRLAKLDAADPRETGD